MVACRTGLALTSISEYAHYIDRETKTPINQFPFRACALGDAASRDQFYKASLFGARGPLVPRCDSA